MDERKGSALNSQDLSVQFACQFLCCFPILLCLVGPPKPSSSRGTYSRAGYNFQAESGPSTSYGTGSQALNSRIAAGNGSSFQSRKNDEKFNRNNSSYARDADYEQHSNKRVLPSYTQSFGTRTNQSKSWDTLGSNKGYLGDERPGYMHDNNHPRILPHSFARGRPGSSSDHTSTSDLYQNVTFGEDRVLGDERLIYQAALQVSISTWYFFSHTHAIDHRKCLIK